MSIVASLCWVDRNTFATYPKRENEDLEMGEDENEEKKASEEKQSSDEELDEETKATIKEFNMDEYDDDNLQLDMKPFYANPEDDPDMEAEDADSDLEEITVLPTDLFILSAVTDVADDFSHLDVHIFEESNDNIYPHHDYVLPSAPLALQWMGYNIEKQSVPGNCVAVATFEPFIELWDLDVLDSTKPACALGGFTETSKTAIRTGKVVSGRKKGRKIKAQPNFPVFIEGSHQDAVMSLSWNTIQKNILASGSADNTVKIWDLATKKCVLTLKHHSDKVQSVAWHPTEANILLTASYDKTMCVVDVLAQAVLKQCVLSADPETALWDPWTPRHAMVSTENGEVLCYDVLDKSNNEHPKPTWTLAAHSKAVTSMSFCMHESAHGLFATTSTDRTIKLWHVEKRLVRGLHARTFDSPIYSLSFGNESGFNLAFGGSDGIALWDVSELSVVQHKYIKGNQLAPEFVPATDNIAETSKKTKKKEVSEADETKTKKKKLVVKKFKK